MNLNGIDPFYLSGLLEAMRGEKKSIGFCYTHLNYRRYLPNGRPEFLPHLCNHRFYSVAVTFFPALKENVEIDCLYVTRVIDVDRAVHKVIVLEGEDLTLNNLIAAYESLMGSDPTADDDPRLSWEMMRSDSYPSDPSARGCGSMGVSKAEVSKGKRICFNCGTLVTPIPWLINVTNS